jgi:hypothetical protein
MDDIFSMKPTSPNEEVIMIQSHIPSWSTPIINANKKIFETVDESSLIPDYLDFDDFVYYQETPNLSLHHYTIMKCFPFSKKPY